MNIWEKLMEDPKDYELCQGDGFQSLLAKLGWKESPEAARDLAFYARSGDRCRLARLFLEYRREQEEGFQQAGRLKPLNAYVLAKLARGNGGDQSFWLGSEYLREGSFLRDQSGEKARNCFRDALRAGQREPVTELGFSLVREGHFRQGALVLETVQRECRDLEREQAKKICRTLGALYLQGKLKSSSPYQGEGWLKYSVEHYEDENAAYTLGMIYREGKVLHADRTEALKYLSYAAERGHSEAGLFMVRGFLDGDPVLGKLDVATEKITRYLCPAAGNLNPEAIYYAGVVNCLCGEFETAAQYMENVKLERQEAYGLLGQIYFLQGKYAQAWENLYTACEEKGIAETIENWFEKGLGEEEACARFPGLLCCMGYSYQTGLQGCCPVDLEKAEVYYKKAVACNRADSLAYGFLAERFLSRNEFEEPDKKAEIEKEHKLALWYWEEAVLRSRAGYFAPPAGTGRYLFLFEGEKFRDDRELRQIVRRCAERLEEYAYRIRQNYQGRPEDGRVLYEYANYIYKQATLEKNQVIQKKIGDEIAENLDLALQAGITDAGYDRARIFLWNNDIDRAYEACKKAADGGHPGARILLNRFKKKVFGGYTYKI